MAEAHWFLLHDRHTVFGKSVALSHDHDTIHAEKGWVEMCNFHMAALMFLTGIKARSHVHVEITHFPNRCIIRTWKGSWAVASCFPDPDNASRWEMWNFCTGMDSCYISAFIYIVYVTTCTMWNMTQTWKYTHLEMNNFSSIQDGRRHDCCYLQCLCCYLQLGSRIWWMRALYASLLFGLVSVLLKIAPSVCHTRCTDETAGRRPDGGQTAGLGQ